MVVPGVPIGIVGYRGADCACDDGSAQLRAICGLRQSARRHIGDGHSANSLFGGSVKRQVGRRRYRIVTTLARLCKRNRASRRRI